MCGRYQLQHEPKPSNSNQVLFSTLLSPTTLYMYTTTFQKCKVDLLPKARRIALKTAKCTTTATLSSFHPIPFFPPFSLKSIVCRLLIARDKKKIWCLYPTRLSPLFLFPFFLSLIHPSFSSNSPFLPSPSLSPTCLLLLTLALSPSFSLISFFLFKSANFPLPPSLLSLLWGQSFVSLMLY